jgi:hypothetical protein
MTATRAQEILSFNLFPRRPFRQEAIAGAASVHAHYGRR